MNGLVFRGHVTYADAAQHAENGSLPKLPESVWHGLLREYREIVEPSTEAPVEFHLASLLVIFAILLGRKAWVKWPQPTFANLFVILIGATSKARKSTAYNIALWLMTMVAEILGEPIKPLYGLSSAEGLAEAMQGPGNRGIATLIIEDEFRSLMTKAEQKGVSNLIPKLTELFNSGSKFEVPTRNNPICVNQPLVGLVSATTKTWLTDSVDVGDAASGFLNRFVMFEAESTRRIAIPVAVDDVKLQTLAIKIADRIREARGEYTLSPGAKELYEQFYHQFCDRTGTETALNLTERAHLHVIKIALMLAVLNGHPQIEREDVIRAIMIAHFSMGVAASLAPHLGMSRVGKLEQRILKHLRANGATSFRDLYRAMSISADEAGKAVATLVKSGEITDDSTKGRRTIHFS